MIKIALLLGVLLGIQNSFAQVGTQEPLLPKNHLPVPITRQAREYSCGAAALLGVLNYWGVYSGPETKLYSLLKTTKKDGTEPQKLLSGAKHYGLKAEMKENLELSDLRLALLRGETVILALQAWRDESKPQKPWSETWEEGHYVVLIAMDETYIYTMDPSLPHGYVYLPQDEFLERWHDYEDRHGKLWRYSHLGVFIKGAKGLGAFPGPLVRME